MPKPIERSPLAAAAEDTIDQLQCGVEYAKWLDALAKSIQDALVGGKACIEARVDHAKTLANLTQYLAHDLTDLLGREVSELTAAIAAAEAKE